MNTVKSNPATSAICQNPPQAVNPFPHEGKVRVKQAAPFLAIGVSTFWLYVKQGRIKRPERYGERVSVWDAEYIRGLAENGIPYASIREVA